MLLLLIKIIPSLLIFQKEFHIRAALKPSVLLGIRNEQETQNSFTILNFFKTNVYISYRYNALNLY